MNDPRITKLAEVLVHYSTEVHPGDKVVIRGGALALPLVQAVYAEVVRAGGFPLPLLSVEGTKRMLLAEGSDAQLGFVHEPMKLMFETYDVFITIEADANTKAATRVSPEKSALHQKASLEIFTTVLKRYEKGELRWMETLFPTNAYAQDAGMSLEEYESFVFNACVPNSDDPIGYWKQQSARQQKAVDWLRGKKTLSVEAPGVELHMNIAGRPFINCDGKGNLPDGEIYTCPVEDSIEGHVAISYPSVYNGRRVDGIQLEIESGRVVRARADSGNDYLQRMLDVDDGARGIGEFALGMNAGITKPTGNTLYDEKIDGSFHIALGASAPDAGGTIESSLHWDLVTDLRQGGRVKADGEIFYKDGQLLV